MSLPTPIQPADLPAPRGHYSPGVRAGKLLFVSGQVPMQRDGTLALQADLATQTRLCLSNLESVLRAGDSSLDRVVKLTVFLAEADGWSTVNAAVAECFGAHRPARSVVPVPPFAAGFLVEIEAVAVVR
ncbi:MAG: RidA family protein [Burkholderiaceae bacterium]